MPVRGFNSKEVSEYLNRGWYCVVILIISCFSKAGPMPGRMLNLVQYLLMLFFSFSSYSFHVTDLAAVFIISRHITSMLWLLWSHVRFILCLGDSISPHNPYHILQPWKWQPGLGDTQIFLLRLEGVTTSHSIPLNSVQISMLGGFVNICHHND